MSDWDAALKRHANYRKRQDRIIAARALGAHTAVEWGAMLVLFPYCLRCGDETAVLTKDHVTPLCHDGSDAIDNLQPLCSRCNSAKAGHGDFRPEDWRERFDALMAFARRLSR